MGGRTLREALAAALEVVPGAELAAGDRRARAALREHLLGFAKDFAFARGVVLEDLDLELELRDVIADLRARSREVVVVKRSLEEPCVICNAKPGEQCATLITCTPREPHSVRKGTHA